MFVSFDGTDGVGKSTQIEMFTQWLSSLGREYVFCRDPGSTALGDALRDILLQKHDMTIDRRSEMFLYMTARTQLVEEIIKPALAEEKLVVCDRYLLANIVYQGHAGGLDPELVRQVGTVATQGIHPALTFVLDMDVTAARQRMNRELDRIESQGLEYMEDVRQGFLKEAARFPDAIQVIDANRTINVIQAEIQQIAAERLNLPSRSI
ncbi:MAG: dTMP kinase [Planctomycetota bacterium]|nr:dTMP kinase [Planctomycetota bacterium]